MKEWKVVDEVVRISSKWLTLIGEMWVDEGNRQVEYWRIEKADSVIVLPIHRGVILTARPAFRPGVKRSTVDFPGGRLPEGCDASAIAGIVLKRELGVPERAVSSLKAMNVNKWNVNSSFSSQGLWAFVATIDEAFEVPEKHVGPTVQADANGLKKLLEILDCLQCRAVLLEWAARS